MSGPPVGRTWGRREGREATTNVHPQQATRTYSQLYIRKRTSRVRTHRFKVSSVFHEPAILLAMLFPPQSQPPHASFQANIFRRQAQTLRNHPPKTPTPNRATLRRLPPHRTTALPERICTNPSTGQPRSHIECWLAPTLLFGRHDRLQKHAEVVCPSRDSISR